MKTQTRTWLLLTAICGIPNVLAADSPDSQPVHSAGDHEPIVIRRKVHVNEPLPKLGARLYDQVDYELQLLQLERDIRIAETELALQRERLHHYDKYFGYTDALLVTRQQARLDVVQTAERLKLLQRTKLLTLRHRNDQVRYRELLLAEKVVFVP